MGNKPGNFENINKIYNIKAIFTTYNSLNTSIQNRTGQDYVQ